MNLDGSCWILGIGVVLASSPDEALLRFHAFLDAERMRLLALYELSEYNADRVQDDPEKAYQLELAAVLVQTADQICYVYGRTSESLKNDGEYTA